MLCVWPRTSYCVLNGHFHVGWQSIVWPLLAMGLDSQWGSSWGIHSWKDIYCLCRPFGYNENVRECVGCCDEIKDNRRTAPQQSQYSSIYFGLKTWKSKQLNTSELQPALYYICSCGYRSSEWNLFVVLIIYGNLSDKLWIWILLLCWGVQDLWTVFANSAALLWTS